MKFVVSFLLVMVSPLVFSIVDVKQHYVLGLGASRAEAGPLSRRRHPQPQPPQSNMQEVDSDEKQKCMEMLQSGDSEGARECMEQLQDGDSGKTQFTSNEVQQETKTPDRLDADKGQGSIPIGKIVSSLPENCTEIVVENINYSLCNDNYYRAAFQGSSLVFVTVEKPK